jgi:hypothetical protein
MRQREFTIEPLNRDDYYDLMDIQQGSTNDDTVDPSKWHGHLCAAKNATGNYPDEESMEHGYMFFNMHLENTCKSIGMLNPTDYAEAMDILKIHATGMLQCPMRR